jgi:hypothetical protein
MREEEYKKIANEYGCTVGLATFINTGALGRKREDPTRYILQAIDMGRYPAMQRKVLGKEWGRRGETTRYRETLKWLRNDKAKPGKI